MCKVLLQMQDLQVRVGTKKYVLSIPLCKIKAGENLLVTGDFSSAVEAFSLIALGDSSVTVEAGVCEKVAPCTVESVSLESAASLIQEEASRDDSEWQEGGVDEGRTAEAFLQEVKEQKGAKWECKDEACTLCGVVEFLSRGLKYLSTGQVRRLMLARALLGGANVLILSDIMAGVDAKGRAVLDTFFRNKSSKLLDGRAVVFCEVGRTKYYGSADYVLHLGECNVAFAGDKLSYDAWNKVREEKLFEQRRQRLFNFLKEVKELRGQTEFLHEEAERISSTDTLIQMRNVHVGWGDKVVLNALDWKVNRGEHWLIMGENGTGKTTLLELITGDCHQVFCNDIKLFGTKRGSGESIWDIKKKLGVVSYRLHVDYRMAGSWDLEAVVLSGFYDTIGLYEKRQAVRQRLARKWLELAGFLQPEVPFSSLSYGQQRMVLIVRSAVKNPELLILDEPCHGVEVEARQQILGLIQDIASTKTTTILYVTHNEDEVPECFHHELCLYGDGKPCTLSMR